MSSISFIKYQAAGNDFILVDDRERRFPNALIRQMCHRQYGIGADGVVLLESGKDFRMRIFNSDGFEAESSGNGLRCFVRFLQELGIVQEKYRIETHAQIVEAAMKEGRPVVDMGKPKGFRFVEEIYWVDTGVPHAVRFVPDVDRIDLLKEGAILRHRFQANVDFAALQPDGSIRVRTFERGVEGETLSCGTGAAAVGYAALKAHGYTGSIPIRFPGGALEVWEEEGRVYLAGPAEKVFTGSYGFSIIDP